MSRLLDPGLGEITDRLTILALKILHGEAAGKDVAHFVRERNGLLTKVRAATVNGSWFEQALALGAVNAALWQRTDEQRSYLGLEKLTQVVEWQSAALCGIAIMRLNDERARLVASINAQVGDNFDEKQGG